MSDYSEAGAVPVEDAATADPPTVDEVLERQQREYPEQARTAQHHAPVTAEELATIEAGAEPVDDDAGESNDGASGIELEGPNSA